MEIIETVEDRSPLITLSGAFQVVLEYLGAKKIVEMRQVARHIASS